MRKLLQLLVSILLMECISADAGSSNEEWPQIDAGIWHVRASRILSGGKPEGWERDVRRCEDPTLIFRGYWGSKSVGDRGCQFRSAKISTTDYLIDSTCILLDGAKSVGHAKVTTDGTKHFVLHAKVYEGPDQTTVHQDGMLVASCSNE